MADHILCLVQWVVGFECGCGVEVYLANETPRLFAGIDSIYEGSQSW